MAATAVVSRDERGRDAYDDELRVLDWLLNVVRQDRAVLFVLVVGEENCEKQISGRCYLPQGTSPVMTTKSRFLCRVVFHRSGCTASTISFLSRHILQRHSMMPSN